VAVEVAAADAAQVPEAPQEVRDEEHHRQTEPRLKSRLPLQLNAETILRRRQHLQRPVPTTRNCWFTLCRTEVVGTPLNRFVSRGAA
jgi:hypothetical protein